VLAVPEAGEERAGHYLVEIRLLLPATTRSTARRCGGTAPPFITVGCACWCAVHGPIVMKARRQPGAAHDQSEFQLIFITPEATPGAQQTSHFGDRGPSQARLPGASTASQSSARTTGPVARARALYARLAVLPAHQPDRRKYTQFRRAAEARRLVAPKSASGSAACIARQLDPLVRPYMHYLVRFQARSARQKNPHKLV